MPRLVGIDKTLELQLTARVTYADEAEKISLITRVCDPDRLMPEAMPLAKAIAAKPPKEVALIRQAIYEGMSLPMVHGLNLEVSLFRELLLSEDDNRLMKEYMRLARKLPNT
jgi:enoyl-CoA hydratase/carnithine racemase